MRVTEIEFEARDGLRLVASAWGDESAPTVLLLHGGGQTRQSWSGTARRLAAAVRGRESDVISLEGVREFQDTVPHAEFVDVSGAAHMVAGDRNDAFTEAVQGFLERHEPL